MSIEGLIVTGSDSDARISATHLRLLIPSLLFTYIRNTQNVLSILELFSEIDVLFINSSIQDARAELPGTFNHFFEPKVCLLHLGRHFDPVEEEAWDLWFPVINPLEVSLIQMGYDFRRGSPNQLRSFFELFGQQSLEAISIKAAYLRPDEYGSMC